MQELSTAPVAAVRRLDGSRRLPPAGAPLPAHLFPSSRLPLLLYMTYILLDKSHQRGGYLLSRFWPESWTLAIRHRRCFQDCESLGLGSGLGLNPSCESLGLGLGLGLNPSLRVGKVPMCARESGRCGKVSMCGRESGRCGVGKAPMCASHDRHLPGSQISTLPS